MGRLGRFSKACTTRSRCPCTELPSGLASEHRVRGLCALGSRLQGCAGWLQVRNFYGLPTEQFHQPCALWHASGFYVMAAAAAGHVYVFHVGTAKVCGVPAKSCQQCMSALLAHFASSSHALMGFVLRCGSRLAFRHV